MSYRAKAKCTMCGKWLKDDSDVCNHDLDPKVDAGPSNEELEAMLLAADEEQAERDAYFAAHGMGCEWEARDACFDAGIGY